MAGRFEGLSEIEWKLFSNLFPVLGKWEKGKPATDPRRVLNMLLYLLFTGCRWYDVPRGPYGSPEVPLIAGFNAGTRIESWLYSRLGF